MPVDAEPSADGNVQLERQSDGKLVAVVWHTSKLPAVRAGFHKSHFVTCPNAAHHRRRMPSGQMRQP